MFSLGDTAERRRPEPLGSSSMLPMIPETVFSETPGPDSGDRPDPLVANGIDEPGLGWVSRRSQPTSPRSARPCRAQRRRLRRHAGRHAAADLVKRLVLLSGGFTKSGEAMPPGPGACCRRNPACRKPALRTRRPKRPPSSDSRTRRRAWPIHVLETQRCASYSANRFGFTALTIGGRRCPRPRHVPVRVESE